MNRLINTIRTLTRTAAGAALIAAALLAPAAPARADIPSPIFDPESVGWLSVRNMTSSQYALYFDQKSAEGYMVTDIEVDIVDGTQRVGAVWQRNTDGRGWAQLRNLTNDEFHDAWTDYKDDGYRLIDQESYVAGGTRYYAGVWVENVEELGWASKRNLTSAEFAADFDAYTDAGFMMIDVEAYPVDDGNALRYAAAWVENSENLAWVELRDLTSAEFAAVFDRYDDDFRMIDVESYFFDGVQYYAGIWVENDGRGWYEYRDMTPTQFGNRWLELRDAGYRLIDYELYETDAGWRTAGIWRQNGDRPDWRLKDDVTALIEAQSDGFDVPGMSVAIAQGGKFVYLRGFGHADIDDGKIAHSRTVYPLASIAKAVGGVLALELQEQGFLDIDQLTSSYVDNLPAHHQTHTVRQTINNRSGIGHYSAYSGQGFAPPYETALEAVEDVDHVPLVFPTGTYTYSTFAYNWLGASIEAVTGVNVREALADTLTAPFSLNTLRAMHEAPADANRATGYNSDNEEIAPHETSHKVLGGGIEASAYDLARFGIKLMDGQILDAASRTDLWTAPDGQSSYALGWTVGTEAGTQVVAKDGSQAGAKSYIRMYPDEEIVIVVLSNRQGGGHDPVDLGRDIGALILAHLATSAASADAGAEVTAAVALPAPDIDEPNEEATDPALIVYPVITDPAPADPADPFAGETEDAEAGEAVRIVYLPAVQK